MRRRRRAGERRQVPPLLRLVLQEWALPLPLGALPLVELEDLERQN
jgi:hypothetical protein